MVANFSRRDGQLVGVVSSSDGSVNALIQLYVFYHLSRECHDHQIDPVANDLTLKTDLISSTRVWCFLFFSPPSHSTPEGPRGGAFYLLGGSSSDEEFDAGAVLMTFDLNNNTGRTLVGSGEWVGIAGGESSSILSKPGFYQVSLLDQNVFIFNVVSGKHLITITATKTAAVGDDAPWWSKFGTPLLFVGAMSISRIVRGFFGEKKPEAGAPAAAGGAVAGGAKAKKD